MSSRMAAQSILALYVSYKGREQTVVNMSGIFTLSAISVSHFFKHCSNSTPGFAKVLKFVESLFICLFNMVQCISVSLTAVGFLNQARKSVGFQLSYALLQSAVFLFLLIYRLSEDLHSRCVEKSGVLQGSIALSNVHLERTAGGIHTLGLPV